MGVSLSRACISGLHLTGLHLIGATGMYLIGMYLASHRQYLIDAYHTSVHLRGRRTFIPIEQTTRPAGVLYDMGWSIQVPPEWYRWS